MLDALLLFEEDQLCYPCLCLRSGTFSRCQSLLGILEDLGVIRFGFVDGLYIIEDIETDKLGGKEGLRWLGKVIDVLLRSNLEDFGDHGISQILVLGVPTIWPNLDSLRDQDPAAIATAILMVGQD